MRAFSVILNHRVVAKDLNFHCVEMRKGDHVLLPTYLAGRDPQAYENPHKIDLNREKSGQLTFGSGPHICLGRHLVRREIRSVLISLLAQFENIHIPPYATYVYHTRGALGIDRLPLAWKRIQYADPGANPPRLFKCGYPILIAECRKVENKLQFIVFHTNVYIWRDADTGAAKNTCL